MSLGDDPLGLDFGSDLRIALVTTRSLLVTTGQKVGQVVGLGLTLDAIYGITDFVLDPTGSEAAPKACFDYGFSAAIEAMITGKNAADKLNEAIYL